MEFFAPCPRGLEVLLSQKLQSPKVGATNVKLTPGSVSFSGQLATMYRANYHSRIASRVLRLLTTAPYRNEHDIHQLALSVPWSQFFRVDQTIKVELVASKSPLKSLDFAALRIKDAVCDYFRMLTDKRPSVDTVSPDVRIHAYLTEEVAYLYLDTSGEALFKRGWRHDKGRAPLRENLAAGLVMLSGWDQTSAFFDPMCGSGTIVIEAAMLAAGQPPGWKRSFAFEGFKGFDAKLWQQIKNEVRLNKRVVPLFASDISAHAMEHLQTNLQYVDLPFPIAFEQKNALEILPPADHGVMVVNPPYGERINMTTALSTDVFYKSWADHLKRHYAGWQVYLLTSDRDTPKYMRLSASKKTPLFNGALDCRLFEFKMVAGSARKPRGEATQAEQASEQSAAPLNPVGETPPVAL